MPTINGGLSGRRVAVLLYSYYPADPRPRREAEALAEAGMEVDLLCLSESDRLPKQEVINGVRVHRTRIVRSRRNKRTYVYLYLRFFLKAVWFLSTRGFRRHYDLVHVHNMPDFLVFAALVPRLRGARIMLDLHDPMPELMATIHGIEFGPRFIWMARQIERWSIAFATVVVTPNLAFRRLFVARSCVPEKIHVILNTPEAGIFTPSALRPPARAPADRGELRIMYHGLIRPRHGLDLLVQAVARLQEEVPGIRLDIFGAQTSFLDEVLAEASRLGVGGRVHSHGLKSQVEIARAIEEADVGVIPNRRTVFTSINFPTRIFEYLAMGVPVIAPETEGIRDYFNAQQLLMFPPGDVGELAARILWVHRHPDEARAVMRAGRGIYEQHLWAGERKRFVDLVGRTLD